mmetsp:Transcript_11635/g.23473  ORF Transcript_11635/g.23473 Transcript_11635/m.23473 type:complete len:227 (+) Transcript_11635:475-1155(+)
MNATSASSTASSSLPEPNPPALPPWSPAPAAEKEAGRGQGSSRSTKLEVPATSPATERAKATAAHSPPEKATAAGATAAGAGAAVERHERRVCRPRGSLSTSAEAPASDKDALATDSAAATAFAEGDNQPLLPLFSLVSGGGGAGGSGDKRRRAGEAPTTTLSMSDKEPKRAGVCRSTPSDAFHPPHARPAHHRPTGGGESLPSLLLLLLRRPTDGSGVAEDATPH